jgi:hypothetical protein
MEFPILYNEAKKKKWRVWVHENVIYRVDCAISKSFDTKTPTQRIIEGKTNCSPEEQAIKEAKKFWVKKLDGGFRPSEDDEEGQNMYISIAANKAEQGGNNHGVSGDNRSVSGDNEGNNHGGNGNNGGGSKGKTKGSLKNKNNEDVDNGVVQGIDTLNSDMDKYDSMLAHKYLEKKKANRILWTPAKYEEIYAKHYKSKKNGKTITHNELVEKINEEYFNASEGCFIQPKLDGVRCVAFLHEGKVVCLSKQKRQFVFLTEQRKDIYLFLKDNPSIILDGEWYNHSPTVDGELLTGLDRFSFITSACRTARSSPHECEHLIEYHIFDIVDSNKSQTERFKILTSLFAKYSANLKNINNAIVANARSAGVSDVNKNIRVPLLRMVETNVVSSEEEMMKLHEKWFVDNDYEGVILRKPHANYEGKRGLNILKYKEFEDAEFMIVGAKSAKGSKEGAVIWICESNDDSKKQFSCDYNVGLEQSREVFKHYQDYIGLPATVRYQTLTKEGVPRFGKAIAIRNYE